MNIFKKLKDDGFKPTKNKKELKKGTKTFNLLTLSTYIVDKYGVDIEDSFEEGKSAFELFNRPKQLPVESSNLYRLWCERETYFFQDIVSDSNQLCNINTLETITNIKKHVLKSDIMKFSGNGDKESNSDILDKSHSAFFVYNPYEVRKSYSDKNKDILNTYTAERYIRNKVANPGKIPPTINNFLLHLFDGENEEYSYCLDWLGNMLKQPNIPYMVLVGTQGVGKNTLIEEIGVGLVGSNNYDVVDNSRLKKEFNGAFDGNMLIHFQEVTMNNPDTLNKLKGLRDSVISIEKKGVDSYKTNNHTNGIITSNDDHEILIEPGERRYSFLKLTETNLVDTAFYKKLGSYGELKAKIKEEIPAFYSYLYDRKIKRDISKPYCNEEHRDRIFESSMRKWHGKVKAYLDSFDNETVKTIGDIFKYMEENTKNGPVISKIEKFLRSFKEVDVKRRSTSIADTEVIIKHGNLAKPLIISSGFSQWKM